MSAPAEAGYAVRPATRSKGQLVVVCISAGSYKTRAMRLIGDGLNCRWSGREGGYIASPRKVERFRMLFAEGWDASYISGKLQEPSA